MLPSILPGSCQIALKEWAVTVQALAQGRQVLLLRKGGIHEEGKDFRVVHPEFLLYPTYEHQREDLLKPAAQRFLKQLLAETPKTDTITFSHWAQVAEIIEVSEQEKVDDLSGHHIWTDAYAQSRLHWKPMLPLSIMLLRVYQLEEPVTIPWSKEYGGCTSWVETLPHIKLGQMQPALSDQEFRREVYEIKGSLGLTLAAG